MAFDPQQFKAQFPLFAQSENAQLVYLDNAATTQKPQTVIDAVSAFYRHSNGNAHRGSHRLGRQATAILESARTLTADFLGAQAEEIVFTRGATEALNLLAFSLTEMLQPGDEIILSEAEHHANLVPWQLAAARKKLVLRFVPVVADSHGRWGLDVSQLPVLLNPKTKIVALTGASNVLGCAVDLPAIQQTLSSIAPATRPYWIVDAAQLAAHQSLNVREIGCDFLVLAGHKLFGPSGVGVLYGKRLALKAMSPWQGGGEMITQVDLLESKFSAPPYRFEAGTSSLADIAGWRACMEFWRQLPRDAMSAHERKLVAYGFAQLAEVTGLQIVNRLEHNLGVISLRCDDGVTLSLADLADWLDQQDIAVRVGHHCAQPLLQRLGVSELLRISLAAYNRFADIDGIVSALRDGIALLTGKSSEQKQIVNNSDTATFWCEGETEGLVVSQLLACKTWQQRYKKLLQWGEQLQTKPALRKEQYRVEACESGAWLALRFNAERLQLAIDSDSRLVKGLAMLLLVMLENKTREELASFNVAAVFTELQFEKYLSESRSNGFWALLRAIEAQYEKLRV